MATIRILIPDATVNYIKNPALRYDTTGWNAAGSAISRSLSYARFGIASLAITTNGAAVYEGAYYRVNDLSGISEPITASIYMRGSGKVRLRLIDNPTGREWISKAKNLPGDRWKRFEVSGYSTGSNDLRLYVESAYDAPKVITFYADGAQMERKAYATTYCAGDQTGCRWSGREHESTSSRPVSERTGGRWVTVASPELEKQDLYMTIAAGLGAAPIKNIINSFAILPGSFHQGVKVEDRVVTLTFHVKREDFRNKTASLEQLHAIRQAFFDLIKPDRTGKSEFIVEYQDGEHPIYFSARYDGGFEGSWDIRNKWVNSFPIRLLSVSPYMWEDDQEVGTIDYQESFLLNNVTGKIDGLWSRMNYGLDGDVYDFDLGTKKELIACGSFTVVNNSASAIAPLTDAKRIAYWDGEKWLPYGAGANGTINDIAVAPNGYIYVTGNFTSIGGVAANRVAYWDGSSWNAIGTGLNGEGHNIEIAPNGYVYVGGAFTTAGGVAANYIARWNGSAWGGMGPFSGLNNSVYTIATSKDGLMLYAGGSFTDEATNPGSGLTRVARYNLATGAWGAMDDGLNGTVYDIVISPSDVPYACGNFSASGAETMSYIAYWNGATWSPLGAGLASTAWSMAFSPVNNDLVVVGSFTYAAGIPAKKVALWNGATWTNIDLDIGQGNTNTVIYAAQFSPSGDLFLGGTQFSGGFNSLFSGITTIENTGTAQVSPRMYIRGSGTLRWIENQTTQKRIFVNLSILANEEVFIDFATASIQSNIRGSLYYSILQGSDFRSFALIPGINKIAAFMEYDVSALMQISYTPTHWGADATAQKEIL